jgi:adenylylsulfate kinase
MKILIMGLPGSGKTTLATELVKLLDSVEWFNADIIREQYNDWDFSTEGRLRQCSRMKQLAENSKSNYVICDFIAPTNEIRKLFNADFTVFVDTISVSKYNDTNCLFHPPVDFNVRVDSKHSVYWSTQIIKYLQTINNINNGLDLSLNNFITQTEI